MALDAKAERLIRLDDTEHLIRLSIAIALRRATGTLWRSVLSLYAAEAGWAVLDASLTRSALVEATMRRS
ncbi:hypothetical protein [Streptomyces sp. NPDC050546]|uniref:hypothetical protein n=1 Tax=Streptomyces sp. NPDC050546 TaxID=3365628 RepID=UPI00378CE8F6